MRTRHLVVFSLLPVLSAIAAETGPVDETLLHMRVAGAVVAHLHERGTPIGIEQSVMSTLDDLYRALDPEVRRWLPTRDGWGRPIHLLLDTDPRLISFGADGRPDVDYLNGDEPLYDPSTFDPTSPDRDIVFSDGDFDERPDPPTTLAETAMEEIRVIGTAMEAFAVDLDRYPGPTDGLTIVGMLAPDLEGPYVRELPRRDPWGRPYYVVSTDKAYAIVSAGADGLLESSYEGPDSPLGRERVILNTDLNSDIVFVDGRFVSAPAVTETVVVE